MGLAETLTVILIILKLLGIISWSWWLVLSPEIVAMCLYIVVWIVWIVYSIKQHKQKENCK